MVLHDALLNNCHIKDEASSLRYFISKLNIRIFDLKNFSQTQRKTLTIKAFPINTLSQYFFFLIL